MISKRSSGVVCTLMATVMLLLAVVDAFVAPSSQCLLHTTSKPAITTTTTSLFGAMNKKGNKFNKQKDLAAKMAEAKRLRELEDATTSSSDDATSQSSSNDQKEKGLTAEEIKLRNDRQRFADMLDNSLQGGGDLDKGYYLTEQQENENADAVCKFLLFAF